MGTLKARALILWDCCQILAYVGLTATIVFAFPLLFAIGAVAAGVRP